MNEDLILEFVEGVSNGNEDAFRQLYEATYVKVFQYLYRLTNNRETAEDLLVDTYTEVWKSAKRFRGKSKVLTWVVGIARNLAMNEFRKNKAKDCELTDETESLLPDQHHNCAASETSGIIGEALKRLPVEHREVVDLVFLQEMRYEDISQIMDIPVNTVKTRVFYAKDKLRDILKQMGIDKNDLL